MDALHCLFLLSWWAASALASLPYAPTKLYFDQQNDDKTIYILEPPSSDVPNGRLLSIDAKSTIDLDNLSPTILTAALPFLNSPDVAYTSISKSDGSLAVYSGDCSAQPGTSQLWTYQKETDTDWALQRVSAMSPNDGSTLAGATYLSSGVSFSTDGSTANDAMYVFGGMCPFPNSTAQSWTSAATYTNQMTVLAPGSGNSDYDFSVTSSEGAPIAEAGFSITALSPTFSKNANGDIVAQQQSFLLLGGQTQDAFINMSQVGLFTLPQAAWAFFPIEDATAKSDLVRRDSATQVEPRSGHTAVLTEDGSKVVVFGGWVGDVSNPAEPQLAVLELGSGFGGAGDWTWTVPSQDGATASGSSGTFGHGATLLPGNIMMVAGGYMIPTVSQADLTSNTRTMLYNATSGIWLNSYDMETAVSGSSREASSGGLLSTSSQKTGLGVGIAFGLLALGVFLLIVFLYWRRVQAQKREREARVRENELRADEIEDLLRVSSAQYYSNSGSHDTGTASERQRILTNAYPWTTDSKQSGWGDMREAERSGYDVDIPSPQRGLRKGKLPIQQTARQEERSMSMRSQPMQPIEEGEEDASSVDEKRRQVEMSEVKDPFADPMPLPLRIDTRHQLDEAGSSTKPARHTISPADKRNREMQNWIRNWSEADYAMKRGSGHVSPTKSERTESTLSEQSFHSTISVQAGNDGRYPRPSFTGQNLFGGASHSFSVRDDRVETALHSSQPHDHDVLAESEALLGRALPPLPPATSDRDLEPDYTPTFTGGARPNRSQSRIGGWVRRAVRPSATSGRSSSMTSAIQSPLGRLIDVSEADYFQGTEASSSSSSPTKQQHSPTKSQHNSIPRRAVSDGGTSFWASKVGARDWGVQPRVTSRQHPPPLPPLQPLSSLSQHPTNQSNDPPPSDLLVRQNSEEDWDIEEASRDRLVQVMFTVPRERLRVVNAEVGSVSDAGGDEDRRRASGSRKPSD